MSKNRQSISYWENESAKLRKQMAGYPARSAASAHLPEIKQAKKIQPLDWNKIDEQIVEKQRLGDLGDLGPILRLQNHVKSMTAEEALASLNEITALDLAKETRENLEDLLFRRLCREDPKLALQHFGERIQDSNETIASHLAAAFRVWWREDMDGAVAWFDQQVADGKLEYKSLDGAYEPRNDIERDLFVALFFSDPAAAGRRLSALPTGARKEVFTSGYFFGGDFISSLRPEDYGSFVTIARSHLPEKDQGEAIALPLRTMADEENGYSNFSDYLKQIGATPAEKAAAVLAAVELQIQAFPPFSKENAINQINAMREWAATVSPEMVDQATAEAISRFGVLNPYAAELSLHYGQKVEQP